MDASQGFLRLADLYEAAKPMVAAICAVKGGLDRDNYAGRMFVHDLLELAVAFGEKAGAQTPRLDKLKKELAKVGGDTTPSAKPIYEMSMAEFLKSLDISEK
ncbi:MAG: hypothetical protein LBH81_01640 [Rickettsiales bacterium]|jgi:hypothetical protein|nr:hypothetical protein [Rickettsiales bacterium]